MPDALHSKDRTAARIAAIYVLFGCLWITLSDRAILLANGGSSENLTAIQTYKGWVFITATGFLIYLLTHRGISQIRVSELQREETGTQFADLVENASDIIYMLDAEGKFISINRAGEELTGYEKDEILNKNLADIVSPEYKKYVPRLLSKAAKEERLVYELEIVKKDGSRLLLEAGNRFILRGGELHGVQGIARNLTLRREMEDRLRKTENRYRELIETTNEGILITDNNGAITFVNEKMSEMLDYDPAEILDNYIADFIEDDLKKESADLLETGREKGRGVFDLKFKTFEGNNLWTIVSIRPMIENDEHIGSILMITDITERKLAEESLKNEQKINNVTISSLPGVFYFFNEEGKYMRWNKNLETVSDYSAGEIAEMNPLDFFADKEKPLLLKRIGEVFEQGESAVTAYLRKKDGTEIPYYFTGRRIMLDGKFYLIGTGIDITAYNAAPGLSRYK